jgi:hypothetical protein
MTALVRHAAHGTGLVAISIGQRTVLPTAKSNTCRRRSSQLKRVGAIHAEAMLIDNG